VFLSPKKCSALSTTQEGFGQNTKYIWKFNNDVYDSFYSEMYDKIHQSDKRATIDITEIIKLTQASVFHSCFLIVGSGTGNVLHELEKLGYQQIYGIDTSQDMIDYSVKKHPTIRTQCTTIDEPMLFGRNTFTHVICNDFGIYHYEDKTTFFKNVFSWLTPGGYLFLHVVDPLKFDTIVPSGRPDFIESPQEYSDKRITRTTIDFQDFKYIGEYDFSNYSESANSIVAVNNPQNKVVLVERFEDNYTKKIRQNERTLFMDTKESIFKMAQRFGFILQGQFDYKDTLGDAYQYLVILERPM
jgi:SAM-dependent methyltransferase